MARGGSESELTRLLQAASGRGSENAAGTEGAEALQAITESLLAGGANAASDNLRQVSSHLDQLRLLYQTQVTTTRENTDALTASTIAKTSNMSELAEIGKSAASFLGRGLALSPLISGIAKLFGGGKEEAPAPLTRFALPPPVQIEGAVSATERGIFPVDFGAGERPRRIAEAVPAPSVTIQVQAMDSRSFLDHREEIAQAVREAMLHSHALNDVVAEL